MQLNLRVSGANISRALDGFMAALRAYMEQEREQERGRGGAGWISLLAFAPLLYVLSIGPAAALSRHSSGFVINQVKTVYQPLIWLHDHTPVGGVLESYVALWCR